MATEELTAVQEEEKEVLFSIYDSDPCFKQIGPQTFQYRVGEAGEPNAFLVEVKWAESYPDVIPEISLDSFFNSHLTPSIKSTIIDALQEEVKDLIGNPMTYSVFEYARENQNELIKPMEGETVASLEPGNHGNGNSSAAAASGTSASKQKPSQLSKAAKRRQADRLTADGELPRGWNWVDIVKLSQTGSKKEHDPLST